MTCTSNFRANLTEFVIQYFNYINTLTLKILKNNLYITNTKLITPWNYIINYSWYLCTNIVVCQTIYGMVACVCEKVKDRIVSNERPGQNFELKGEPSWGNGNLLIGFLKVEQYWNRKMFNAYKMGNWLNFYYSSTL